MNRMKPTSLRITLALFLLLFFTAASFLLVGSPVSARVGSLVSSVGQRAVKLISPKSEKVVTPTSSSSSARAAVAPNLTVTSPTAFADNDLRVVSQSVPSGTTSVIIFIEYDAPANINALGFSVHFNPAHLSLSGAPTIVFDTQDPAGLPLDGTTLLRNPAGPIPPSPATGQIGFNISLDTGTSMTPGTHKLIRLPFTILSAMQCGLTTPITIEATPTSLSASSPAGTPLTDPNGVDGSLTVAGPTITVAASGFPPPNLPNGVVNVLYTVLFQATGGTAPRTFALAPGSGPLPTGINVQSNGVVTGTPTQSGIFSNIVVRATDANGCFGDSAPYTLQILCPAITLSPPTLPAGTVGTAYNVTVTTSPGDTFQVTSGTLPAGLTLATNGQITGTPTSATNPGNFTITATGAGGCQGSQVYNITVNCPTITLSPPAGALTPATVLTPYAPVQFSADVLGPHTFHVFTGALPPGMNLSSSGLLTGTPTTPQAGPYQFGIAATGPSGCAGSAIYTLQVNCPVVTITPAGPALPSGTLGTPYSQQLTATGTTGTTTFTVISGTLIPGLTLSSDGLLSGTPAFGGQLPFEVRATDVNGCTATRSYTLQINCPGSITLSPPTLPAASLGVPYSQVVTASPDLSPLTYFFHLGGTSLPPGLTLNSSTGEISGTPTSALNSPYVFTVFAIVGSNCLGNQQYSITVQCPLVTVTPPAGPLPAATANSPYAGQQFAASGTTGPFTFAVTSGAIPAGMTLSSAGLLSGTPTTPGPYGFTVTATSTVNGCSGSTAYTLQVSCSTLTIAPTSLPDGTIGIPYSQQLTPGNGTGAPINFTLQSGTLPTGITLSTSGLLAGTATQTGVFPSLVVRATDVNGCFGERTFQLTIQCPVAIVVSPLTLANPQRGIAYNAAVTAAPPGTYTFALTNGVLPPGLTLSTAGVITGTTTTTQATPFVFTITAEGPGPCVGSREYSVTVVCPTITLSPAAGALPAATANTPYAQQITPSGGAGPYTFGSTGTLPAGVTLNPSTGLISGTPTIPGPYSLTVTATDANQCTGSAAYTLQVNCPILTMTPAAGALTAATAGTPYNQNFVAANGTGAFTYSISAGALPTGLTLSGAGVLSGTPTVIGGFSFSVRALDTNNCSVIQAYTLQVSCQTITVNPPTVPDGTAGVAYAAQNITQVGGIGAVTFAISAGALPTGMTLSPAGVLSGTPTVTGPFNFTVRATDSNGCTGTQAYSITIACAPIVFSPAVGALPGANTSTNYNQQITVTGTIGTNTFTINSGTLPTGIVLSPTGLLSGIPTALGPFNFVVRVTDSNACTSTVAYSITVTCGTITVSPSDVPDAPINVPYSQTFTALGGTAPRTFSFTGTLPTGMSLSPGGVLSGTPSVLGDFTFTVIATDVNSCTGSSAPYTLSVLPCTPITVDPPSIPTGFLGVPYSQTFTQTGAVGTATFSVTGTLPTGLTFVNGVLSGTPLQSGVFNFSVNVLDSRSCPGSRAYTLTIERVAFVQSDESSGSILIYNFYSSSVSQPGGDNTRINITNTSQIRGILVHLFFVDGVTCSIADSSVCLTANQTATFLMSDMDPGTRGYLIAIAVDSLGCPTNFNFLIGDEFVKTTSGHTANLGAEAVSALSDVPSVCDSTSFQASIPFDGVNYSSLPRVLAVSGIASPATGNSTLLVLNRIGGNLLTGSSSIGALFGLLFDDAERPHSFTISSGSCQYAAVLSNSVPRTSPRFDQVIPAGSTGWLKLWGVSDIALLGVAINLNVNSTSSADAYSQGHNLHKLKVTNSATLTVPIFAPGC